MARGEDRGSSQASQGDREDLVGAELKDRGPGVAHLHPGDLPMGPPRSRYATGTPSSGRKVSEGQTPFLGRKAREGQIHHCTEACGRISVGKHSRWCTLVSGSILVVGGQVQHMVCTTVYHHRAYRNNIHIHTMGSE